MKLQKLTNIVISAFLFAFIGTTECYCETNSNYPDIPNVKIAKTISLKGIDIIGSDKFINQVSQSLKLIEAKDSNTLGIIKKYVGIIKEAEHSGMWAYKKPPVYDLADKTAFSSVTWCASTIAHDSYHSKLYHEYQAKYGKNVPDDIWTGIEAEKKCIGFQLYVAVKIGAPKYETDYLKSLDGTHYDINNNGKSDWDDYNKRNW